MESTKKTFHKPKTRAGISVVELLIGVTIAGFISVATFSIYFAHYRIYLNQTALIQAETQNRLAMTEILKYVRQGLIFQSNWSYPSTPPYNADDITDCQASTPSGSASTTYDLEIGLPRLDANGNAYFTDLNPNNLDKIRIYRNPNSPDQWKRLILTIEPASGSTRTAVSSKVIGVDICKFRISYNTPLINDASYVNVTLTTKSKTIYGKIFTSTQTARAYIRD